MMVIRKVHHDHISYSSYCNDDEMLQTVQSFPLYATGLGIGFVETKKVHTLDKYFTGIN